MLLLLRGRLIGLVTRSHDEAVDVDITLLLTTTTTICTHMSRGQMKKKSAPVRTPAQLNVDNLIVITLPAWLASGPGI